MPQHRCSITASNHRVRRLVRYLSRRSRQSRLFVEQPRSPEASERHLSGLALIRASTPHKRRRDVRFRAPRRTPFEAVSEPAQSTETGFTSAITVSTPRSALYFVE